MAKTREQIIKEYVEKMKGGFEPEVFDKNPVEKKEYKKENILTPEKIKEYLKEKGFQKKSDIKTKTKTVSDDSKTAALTESNPLRDQYRAQARTKILSKLTGVDMDDPLAAITGKKQKPPEHQYDIMGRLNVDRRRAQYGIRKQFAMPLQNISQRPLGAKEGTFVKVKCKLGRNKKTRIT
jgi:hypothetical protein